MENCLGRAKNARARKGPREPQSISLNDSQSQRTFSSDWGKKKKIGNNMSKSFQFAAYFRLLLLLEIGTTPVFACMVKPRVSYSESL